MSALRFDTIPARMRSRPVDHRGFPVPWFVTGKTDEGLWDFVRLDPARLNHAYKRGLCTLSGEPLGKYVSFVVGPMCIINRVAAEPPCIPELGKWAAQVCPFLSRPMAKRPDMEPGTFKRPPGGMVEENPGGCVVWTVRRGDFERGRDRLYRFGDPTEVTFWTKGREATAAEAWRIYTARADSLRAIAAEEGHHAVAEFEYMKARADRYLPSAEGGAA